ncbi:TetR/AcrR family transcriptional regulator [Paraferrimonas sp. SM1919]|uniref:TetR/AcrR family transcriptional regulator n=1 Tax=Paraferrimonas sp. SM1919 TaxID=2662263 RepID=UPI0013D1A7CB|nr:TetR/AcrR family transcriptional regulator [Paraferrimonas sp. SM1919]
MTKLKYLGKAATRIDGVKRRISILEATLTLIGHHGIRGVKHRSVAQQAKVPLSATTYYFDDIDILINDAFTYFAEKSINRLKSLQKKCFALIPKNHLGTLTDEARWLLISQSGRYLADHIYSQISQPLQVKIENAFKEESMRNPPLARAFDSLGQGVLMAIGEFFNSIGSQHPEVDGLALFAIANQIEFTHAELNNEVTAEEIYSQIEPILQGISLRISKEASSIGHKTSA